MQSKAKTVAQYLKELPVDRREIISRVREVILKNLDHEFEEGMQYGMIGYYVPHKIFPEGYHCDPTQPLSFACLASQKNYISVYLMSVYSESPEENWFRKEWGKTGKRLDMGKCCVRFKKLEDAALDVIGEAIKRVSARKYIAKYVEIRKAQESKRATNKTKPTKKVVKKTTAPTKRLKKKLAKKPRQ